MRIARAAAATAALAFGLTGWTPAAAVPASDPIDLGGQPVESSTDPREPIALEAGLWTVGLGPANEAQYFTYDRQIENSTIHVGAIGAPPTLAGDGISLKAEVPPSEGGTTPVVCGDTSDTTVSSTAQDLVGTHVLVGEEDDNGACRSADTVTLTLARYSSYTEEDLPVALKIVEEAPVRAAGAVPPDDDELRYDAPTPVPPVELPGAASFDDAPLVDAGDGPVTISADITEGTELLWRVPVAWGDQLVARVDLPTVPAEDERIDTTVQLHLVQPDRDVFVQERSEHDSYGDVDDEATATAFAATYPLRYANRTEDVEPTLPGDHWVAVAVEHPDPTIPAQDVTVELTLAVTHTDAEPPTYPDAVLAQGSGAGPEGYSPETPFLVGDGEFAAVASGSPFTPESDDDGWWGARRAAGIGLGLVSLACCAVGGIWLSRRAASR